jgi:quercetin dioxygenase-like cupin family protein
MTTADANHEDLTAHWDSGEREPGRIDFAVATDNLEPGASTGRRERGNEQVVMVVDGHARARVDGEEARLSRGSSVLIPALVQHEIENVGDSTLRIVSAVNAERAA